MSLVSPYTSLQFLNSGVGASHEVAKCADTVGSWEIPKNKIILTCFTNHYRILQSNILTHDVILHVCMLFIFFSLHFLQTEAVKI